MEQLQLHIWKKKPLFLKKNCTKLKYVLLCWNTSCAAGQRGDSWRVPPICRQGFYEHSSQSLCTFTREQHHYFMWSPPGKIKYLYPEGLLGRRAFFDSVQLYSPEVLWSKYFTRIRTTKTYNHSNNGVAEFPTLSSCEELCMATVVQGGNNPWH